MARYPVAVERRFSDLDVLGHVNNVTYLVYLEEARVRLLRRVADRVGGADPMTQVVARTEIDYLHPLLLKAEPVVVDTWVSRVGRSSYEVRYLVLDDDGTVAARARTVQVFFDPATGGSAPIPAPVRAVLEAVVEPDEA